MTEKIKPIVLKFLIFIFLAGLSYIATQYFMSKTSQPIAFNHKQHIVLNEEDSKMNCLQCHVPSYDDPESAEEGDSISTLYRKFLDTWKVETKKASLAEKKVISEPGMVIPTVELCATCHGEMEYDKAKNKTAALKKIIDYSKKEKNIPWQRNYRLADHLMYSHSRHIAYGKQDCTSCHGDMANRTDPVTSPVSKTLNMFDGCLACHKKKKLRKLSTDCISCHK